MAALYWDAISKKGHRSKWRGTVCYGHVWGDDLVAKYDGFVLYFPLNDRGGTFDQGVEYTQEELRSLFAYADHAGLKNVCKGVDDIYKERDYYGNDGDKCPALAFHVSTKGMSGIAIRTLFNLVRTTCEQHQDWVGKYFLRFCNEGGPEPILNKLIVALYGMPHGQHHSLRPSNGGMFELHDDAWYTQNILKTRRKSCISTDYFPYRTLPCDCGWDPKNSYETYNRKRYAVCPEHGAYNTPAFLMPLLEAVRDGKSYEECKALYLEALDKCPAIVKPKRVKA